MVRGPPIRHREPVQDLRGKPEESGTPECDCERSARDREQCLGNFGSASHGRERTTMIHAEGQAGLPPFTAECRMSGVLLHVTSLPSPYGVGDVGPAAFSWVDALHEAGQTWWQALPLGPTGLGNSPYASLSSFAGNALLVSPDLLIQDGLLTARDCEEGRTLPKSPVDFEAVITFKHRLLELAWSNFSFSARPALRSEFDRFCSEQAHWLEDYALFRALKFHFKGADFLDWPQDLVRRDPSALARARR